MLNCHNCIACDNRYECREYAVRLLEEILVMVNQEGEQQTAGTVDLSPVLNAISDLSDKVDALEPDLNADSGIGYEATEILPYNPETVMVEKKGLFGKKKWVEEKA